MHSTMHAVCGQQKGQNRAKSHVTDNYYYFFFYASMYRYELSCN